MRAPGHSTVKLGVDPHDKPADADARLSIPAAFWLAMSAGILLWIAVGLVAAKVFVSVVRALS
jgi:hypothetical protein